MKYSVSFRVPYNLFGTTQTFNGSCSSPYAIAKAAPIVVTHPKFGAVSAEVVECKMTQRNSLDYEWRLMR